MFHIGHEAGNDFMSSDQILLNTAPNDGLLDRSSLDAVHQDRFNELTYYSTFTVTDFNPLVAPTGSRIVKLTVVVKADVAPTVL